MKDLYWLLFALIVIPIALILQIIRRARKTYRCPLCKKVVKPGFRNFGRIIYNWGDDRVMIKCPSCDATCLMQESTH